MSTNDGMVSLSHHAAAWPYRDLAIGRWRHGGFVVFVHGAVLREKRHFNERVFTTEEAAIAAGQRVRR